MYHWLKRVLATATLASGAVILMAGVASADVAADLGSITDQVQQATNSNQTNQNADAEAETNQLNVYAPVTVFSKDSNNGDVDQSNDADTTAVAVNDNETDQSIEQDQKADLDDGDACRKCGSDGAASQSQEAENDNSTDQAADASAETNQVNVYAPVAVFSKDSNNGDVNQSNEADTTAKAVNDNSTEQSVDQDQSVRSEDADKCGKCGSDGDVSQSQKAANDNTTDQDADATAKTDQSNLVKRRSEDGKSHAPKDGDRHEKGDKPKQGHEPDKDDRHKDRGHHKKGHGPDKDDRHKDRDHREKGDHPKKGDRHGSNNGDVSQSNEADTTAKAVNDNSTEQSVDQDQSVRSEDADKCGKCGSDGDVSQSQKAANDNATDQAADASAETNQQNVYAPVALFSKNSNNGDVNQSNEADTTAVAANDSETGQSINQDQSADRRDGGKWHGKCGSDGESFQSQKAANDNTTDQEADASAETNQQNVYAPVALFSKNSNNGDVNQSNEADTTAIAVNQNTTGQAIHQLQDLLAV